jgi:uncharacterized protein (TIGR02453 family)
MPNTSIDKSTLAFLKDLDKHNNRDWMASHKGQYIAAQENMIAFTDTLITLMSRHDKIKTESGKRSLYRIFNDMRFHKDKAPYNPRFAGSIARVKPYGRGGYHFAIKPGGSQVSCGFFAPNPEDLKRIRTDILYNYKTWNRILQSKPIRESFGELLGKTVESTPRGFPKEHPAIHLLRKKQFILKRTFTDKEVLAPDFADQVNITFKSVRKYFDYMSEVLTTDLNGESILP